MGPTPTLQEGFLAKVSSDLVLIMDYLLQNCPIITSVTLCIDATNGNQADISLRYLLGQSYQETSS
jgi:hypothetical protein